jgi:hypothetical protein
LSAPQIRLLLEAAHGLRADLASRGSGLAWAPAPPAAALPAALRAAGPALAAAGVGRVQLVHALAPCGAAGALAAEAEAAAAFEAEAHAQGLAAGVTRVWGATLYHPDDLPYAAFSGARPAQPPPGCGAPAAQRQRHAAEGGDGAADEEEEERAARAEAAGAAAAVPANADARRYRCLPRVMAEFRRAVQAGAAPLPPLPPPPALPPLPPGTRGGSRETGGGSAAAAGALPEEWWAPLPRDVLDVYEAAGPEALAALRRLAELTGRPSLTARGGAVPVYAGGAPDARSAFPFAGGEAAAAARLEGFLRGSGGGSGGGAGTPLEGFVDARCVAEGPSEAGGCRGVRAGMPACPPKLPPPTRCSRHSPPR